MWLLAFLVFFVLGVFSLRGLRSAYITFVLLGLLYFPAKVGFRLDPRPCELSFNIPLALHSLTNYSHIVLFALFFVMTSAQFRKSNWQVSIWSATATIAMGVLVEIAQGVTGKGHCRLRDLIPDAVGIIVGSAIMLLWIRMRESPRPSV